MIQSDQSQYGESPILEDILRKLGRETGGACVEFGAWDGRRFSNYRKLLVERGFSGVLTEGEIDRFRLLKKNFSEFPLVSSVNRFVKTHGEDSLDRILARCNLPKNFDVLSIDIDGNDFHIWKSLVEFTPKIVVIEFNPSIPNSIYFVQLDDDQVNQGSSIRALVDLGLSKGYQLVATTTTNAVFVLNEYFHLFPNIDNSLDTLRADTTYLTTLFQLYDGTVVVVGCNQLIWDNLPFPLQYYPALLRGPMPGADL